MTPSIVDGLAALQSSEEHPTEKQLADCTGEAQTKMPLLKDAAVGNPISHGQIIDLWQKLQSSHSPCSLEKLLQGSRVYIPPPAPKPAPSAEYKNLMARLHREEAAREYERMVNPPPRLQTFNELFPHGAQSYAEANRPMKEDIGDDDVTYSEVHRQVMLIINFLVSIVGVAATLWVTARWWSTPARLLLTLGGSILVAVAEVFVYQAYLWRMGQSKTKQKTTKEIKEVVQTWVVAKEEDPILLQDHDEVDGTTRKRIRKPKAET
ncbi:vacuolar H+-ATPase assembly protein [Drechmeria coniospora]|uniref:Vacuolar H+-ATPase assembly protein n=1 Tax=Drechmeria coniospora TaxID=98403 RepID=A0A151GAK6_DRECN|nr:vacuolar H+-ATPase assembly protein [Drechmeria coniospora]KYK54114.1 vacuolar H+-ATPase assembly protein [Drechmeria coniospora]